jgi:hypothetical protein
MGTARLNTWLLLAALSISCSAVPAAQTNGGAATSTAAMGGSRQAAMAGSRQAAMAGSRQATMGGSRQAAMDRDLLEVTIPKLETMYAAHRYTVTQVVQWYIARIAKYNGIYRAVQTVDAKGALATAAEEDAAAKRGGPGFQRGPMWGVPIVVKANTSVKGLITTDGWQGYLVPGHELIAPKDATIVAKLRAAGVVILARVSHGYSATPP